jgi:hypothetical protein
MYQTNPHENQTQIRPMNAMLFLASFFPRGERCLCSLIRAAQASEC